MLSVFKLKLKTEFVSQGKEKKKKKNSKLFLEQKSKWLQTSQNPQTGTWRGAASLLLEQGLALLATLHGPMEHATEWSTQLRSRNKTAFIRGRGRGDRGLTSGRLDVQTVPRPTHQLDPASATAD